MGDTGVQSGCSTTGNGALTTAATPSAPNLVRVGALSVEALGGSTCLRLFFPTVKSMYGLMGPIFLAGRAGVAGSERGMSEEAGAGVVGRDRAIVAASWAAVAHAGRARGAGDWEEPEATLVDASAALARARALRVLVRFIPSPGATAGRAATDSGATRATGITGFFTSSSEDESDDEEESLDEDGGAATLALIVVMT